VILRRNHLNHGSYLDGVLFHHEAPPQHVQVFDPMPSGLTPPQAAVSQREHERRILTGSSQGMHLLVSEVDVRFLDLARQSNATGGIADRPPVRYRIIQYCREDPVCPDYESGPLGLRGVFASLSFSIARICTSLVANSSATCSIVRKRGLGLSSSGIRRTVSTVGKG